MSFAIFSANFPTLVPPNFCTSHLAAGSIEFWCRFGGVVGVENDESPETEPLEDDSECGVDGGVGSTDAMVVDGCA